MTDYERGYADGLMVRRTRDTGYDVDPRVYLIRETRDYRRGFVDGIEERPSDPTRAEETDT